MKAADVLSTVVRIGDTVQLTVNNYGNVSNRT